MRRFFLFIFGLLILANFAGWFALNALLGRLAAPGVCRWTLGVFIVVQVVGLLTILTVRLFGYQPGTGMGRPLLSLILIWNLLLALPTAVVSMTWLMAWWMAAPGGGDGDPASPWREMGLAVAAAPFVLAILATAVAQWQLNHFRVKRMTLEIANLPPALEGLSIAHLSDIHIGKLTRGKVLDDMVAATNRLNPDLILLTGDLINFALEDLPTGLEMLRKMKARHGLYLCEGNHDLIEDEAQFEATAQASGLRFLLDEVAAFSVKGAPVQVAGIRWDEGMRRGRETAGAEPGDAVNRLLAQGSPGAFTILLAHHPHVFDAAAQAGIPLTLAGHTHGGQLMLTPTIGFGPWLYRYWSGLYRKGASQLVVSNGAGNWFPLRIGAPAEIIELTLQPAPANSAG